MTGVSGCCRRNASANHHHEDPMGAQNSSRARPGQHLLLSVCLPPPRRPGRRFWRSFVVVGPVLSNHIVHAGMRRSVEMGWAAFPANTEPPLYNTLVQLFALTTTHHFATSQQRRAAITAQAIPKPRLCEQFSGRFVPGSVQHTNSSAWCSCPRLHAGPPARHATGKRQAPPQRGCCADVLSPVCSARRGSTLPYL